jgi:polyisoprenoid-binding protein YceI
MKYLIMIIMLAASWMVQAQVVVSHDAMLSFFSEAPIENIKAESNTGVSALNLSSETIYFKVPMRSFEFKKSLMQEHFNENYMESSKYPFAEFNGKIIEQVDLTKDGTYPVIVQGELNIHGVKKNYNVKAELKVKGGEISANSTFPVKLADHEIKIPRLVIKNIAEVVQVTVSAHYKPDSKEAYQSNTSPKMN